MNLPDLIDQFQKLVGARAAYPLVGVLLTLVLQLGKLSPFTKVLYAKTPVGWRWLAPVAVGGLMGFVHGFQAGRPISGALVEAVFGIFGISATAMGVHAALTESPLPWNGKAGGVKGTNDEPPSPGAP